MLIGDSQSAGAAGTSTADTWPMQALSSLGYVPRFRGRGGTGYVAGAGGTGNFLQALRQGDWLLPHGDPPLVVVQGGGNDVRIGATDAQIVRNAELLLDELRRSYPKAAFVLVGTLGRGTESENAADVNRRRSEVDALLGAVAARRGIPFVSVGDWLTRYDAVPLLADKVHLRPQGHRLLAAVLAVKFQELGLSPAAGTQLAAGTLPFGVGQGNSRQ